MVSLFRIRLIFRVFVMIRDLLRRQIVTHGHAAPSLARTPPLTLRFFPLSPVLASSAPAFRRQAAAFLSRLHFHLCALCGLCVEIPPSPGPVLSRNHPNCHSCRPPPILKGESPCPSTPSSSTTRSPRATNSPFS